ncbi:hypothetical protein [Pseudoalteromonas shioyasakiensis]|uniref:hypothetical protein n=1 Tax=Pseudoalteromonas shioyasakiensis TaxID=1190813 RepID=UPI0025520AD9|nr:hypothetical protein [Pseudoalteromonas shioyasakiensis]MDK9683257.1 hypothetical protein [Pseudoalteromonas shioyasakiensis]
MNTFLLSLAMAFSASNVQALSQHYHQQAQLKPGVQQGSVFENKLTNELATVTGNILVLAHSQSQLHAIAHEHNLHVVSTTSGLSLAVMQAADKDSDLETIVEALAADPRVKQAKLELNETRFYTR